MTELFRRVCDPTAPHRNPKMNAGCSGECFVPVTIDYEAIAEALYNEFSTVDASEWADVPGNDKQYLYGVVGAAVGEETP